jgi:hypothetical protein
VFCSVYNDYASTDVLRRLQPHVHSNGSGEAIDENYANVEANIPSASVS